MDRQPVLEGERLLLRPLTEADWEAFHAAASDPLIWAQHPASDRWRPAECRAWFEGALDEGALAAKPRAWFLIAEENWRSRKAIEKIGGQLTDETFTAELPSGPVLHLIYEITRESFANGPLAEA